MSFRHANGVSSKGSIVDQCTAMMSCWDSIYAARLRRTRQPEGDRLAAENLAAAAATMLKSPGAMQLRTLQTLDGLGPTASNTVVLAIPVEVMQLAQRLSRSADT